MLAPSPLLRLLAVAPLLAATLSHALPSDRRSWSDAQPQMVLGGQEPSSQREPDFVEAMLAEAKRKGMDLQQFGVSQDEMDAMDLDRFAHTTSSKASTLTADLTNEAERIALMAEAAAEDTLAWIQPVVQETKAKTIKAMEPGSGWVWNVCGNGDEAVILRELKVSPDPPVAGQNLTVYAKGTLNADIKQGTYADVTVKLGFIRLINKRFDVCDLAEENDTELKCPQNAGEYEMTHTTELPREIPPAKYAVHVTGSTQDGVPLLCGDIAIDFRH